MLVRGMDEAIEAGTCFGDGTCAIGPGGRVIFSLFSISIVVAFHLSTAGEGLKPEESTGIRCSKSGENFRSWNLQ